jgi:hypothetical protein
MKIIKETKNLLFNYARYEVLPATDLKTALEEALVLANNMDVNVEFSFKGHLIRIDKNDSIQEKIDFYNEAIINKQKEGNEE